MRGEGSSKYILGGIFPACIAINTLARLQKLLEGPVWPMTEFTAPTCRGRVLPLLLTKNSSMAFNSSASRICSDKSNSCRAIKSNSNNLLLISQRIKHKTTFFNLLCLIYIYYREVLQSSRNKNKLQRFVDRHVRNINM